MTVAVAPLTVSQAVEHRRSIRAYSPEPVSHADLEEILRLTGLAPSAWNLQPWRFVIVEDPALRRQLADAAYGQAQVAGAPAVIVLYTDMADTLERLDDVVRPGTEPEAGERFTAQVRGVFAKQTGAERETWAAAQGYIALGYLVLAAESLGYSTSPMLGFDPAGVKKLLGLPEHVRIPALVAIGRGAEAGQPHHRHPVERLARYA
jgi:nitroreductase